MPEIEILRKGKFVSMSGVEVDINSAVLQQVVESYNPANFKAPLIVSHDTGGTGDRDLAESELAYGFPSALKIVGDRVKAIFDRISPRFTEWVRNGQLLGVSSSLYTPDSSGNPYPGKWSLRHIAGLGKNPPAIKGLSPLALKEWRGEGVLDLGEFDQSGNDDSLTIDLSDSRRTELLSEAMQQIREGIIDTAGIEEADRLLPHWMIRSFEEARRPEVLLDAASVGNAEPRPDKPDRTLDMADEELRAELEAERKKNEALTAQIAAESWKARCAECKSFCEDLQRKGVLTSGMLQVRTVDFSEGDEKKSDKLGLVDFMAELKPRQLEFFKGLLGKLPKQVHFGEAAGDDRESPPVDSSSIDPNALAEKMREVFQERKAAGQNVAFHECVGEAKKRLGVVEA